LSCSLPPPDLHSFPTRRSSDLTSYVYMACPENDVDGTRLPLDVEVWAASFPHLRHAFEVLAHETPFRSYYCYINCKAWSRSRIRSEEHTSELQSRFDLVCRLLL